MTFREKFNFFIYVSVNAYWGIKKTNKPTHPKLHLILELQNKNFWADI